MTGPELLTSAAMRLVGVLINGTEFIPQHLVTYPFAVPPGQDVQAVYVRADL